LLEELIRNISTSWVYKDGSIDNKKPQKRGLVFPHEFHLIILGMAKNLLYYLGGASGHHF
jgi:hypothetical protein